MSANPAVLDMARDRPELVRGVVAKPFDAGTVVSVVEGLVGEPPPSPARDEDPRAAGG
jgi:hypothetical protein